MLKISEFSRLSQVTVKALRYYDEIGLLPPAEVDQWTKYRYYSAEQLPRLRRIVMLKGLGFPLVEIGRILNDNLNAEQIASIARLRRADLHQQLSHQQLQLNQLDYWLERLTQEKTMPQYITEIKTVEPLTVAYVRETIPTMDDLTTYLTRMFTKAETYAVKHDAYSGRCIAEYYDQEFTGKDMDVATAVILSEPIPAGDGVEVLDLTGGTVAYVTHVGPYHLLQNAYQAILEWIAASDYTIVGAGREYYHNTGEAEDQSDFVTEVQFFVEKK